MIPRKIHRARRRVQPCINMCCVGNTEKIQHFLGGLQEVLTNKTLPKYEASIDAKWSHLRDVIYNSAIIAYGKKEQQNEDWFEAHWQKMKPVVEAKRTDLLAHKRLAKTHLMPGGMPETKPRGLADTAPIPTG